MRPTTTTQQTTRNAPPVLPPLFGGGKLLGLPDLEVHETPVHDPEHEHHADEPGRGPEHAAQSEGTPGSAAGAEAEEDAHRDAGHDGNALLVDAEEGNAVLRCGSGGGESARLAWLAACSTTRCDGR